MMGYREEEGGAVVITMSRGDWQTLLLLIGFGMSVSPIFPSRQAGFAFANRLNVGNPNYEPYEVGSHADPR